MNTSKLRDFAPAARKGLIAAITAKALRFGIRPGKPIPKPTLEGEFVRIEGVLHPRSVLALFNDLSAKIAKHGFDHVVEEAAYTWFNRLAAIRYMEVHGYLSHGLRVLSAPDDATLPEILQQAQSVEIEGLDRKAVLELLTLGNRQEELYQLLLRAQCHALSNAMPFLFDRIDGATELLTPDGLLSPSSIVREIVREIPEDDWRTTEILGWLYQFYVSEEKARVDGLVKKGQAVAPEDIPAKTQLFTPNWIVQFLVQNSLGRLWMDVYPDSPLRDRMPYYTPPAEQTPEVAAQLAAITPKYLDPTELTAIDPAAGSGHILLELYNLFFEMYREHGTLPSDIPRLIVERNLFGLELDRRAAQIAGFAVLMRARADDPRLLENPPKLNVHAIRHSRDLDLSVLIGERKPEPIVPDQHLFEDEAAQPKLIASAKPLISDATTLRELVELFRDADIEGSLIRFPASLLTKLDRLEAEVQGHLERADLLTERALLDLRDLIRQARLLARKFTTCVANPPYLGGKAMIKELKEFAKAEYPNTKSDLFAMFMERGFDLIQQNGFNAMVTMQAWMFLSSYLKFRTTIVSERLLMAMAHLGARGFRELSGEVVQTTCTVFRKTKCESHRGVFFRLIEGEEEVKSEQLRRGQNRYHDVSQREMMAIPGLPIAYWADRQLRSVFELELLELDGSTLRQGMSTTDNNRYLRYWFELSIMGIAVGTHSASEGYEQGAKFFPYNKGGVSTPWSGWSGYVIDYANNGDDLIELVRAKYPRISDPEFVIKNRHFFFRQGVTWTELTSGRFSARRHSSGFIFDATGPCLFSEDDDLYLSFLNSKSVRSMLGVLSPNMHFSLEHIAKLPSPQQFDDQVKLQLRRISSEQEDRALQLYSFREECTSLQGNFSLQLLETHSCSRWVEATLRTISSTVDQLTVVDRSLDKLVAGELSYAGEAEREGNPYEPLLFSSQAAVLRLCSFALGNLMGRYSLDEPGLIYAHAGNEGFDPSRYRTFPADADGILSITDDLYFGEEDTAERLAQWVKTVWPNSPLEENLAFIADSLYAEDGGRKPEETPLEAIRRYLVNDFYRDHLQTYKNRPIYWMFTSGKKKAFQALVYLHRYTPNTLSRMRSDYVQPLLGQLQARLDDSRAKEQSASSTASKKAQSRFTKKLADQYEELLEFDKRLHFYALQGIALDLDDGVKVNYGKFHDPKIGPILAEEKKITGGKDD